MLDFGSPLDGIRSPLGPRRGGFNPKNLFSSTAIGTWFDPSDLTTMYQDAAGTTAVTTPGQPVGLRLDKSKGLALGAELVANGTFDSATGWTVSAQSSITGGQARIVSADGTFQNVSQAKNLTGPAWYEVSLDVVSVVSGSLNFAFTGAGVNTGIPVGTGRRTLRFFVASNTSSSLSFGRSAGVTDVTIDNISVRELPGNHATQSVLASRPVYGIEPAGGRRNLLTYTEDLSDVVWVKVGATVIPQGDGSALVSGLDLAGDRLDFNTAFPVVNGETWTYSVDLRGAGSINIAINSTTATGGATEVTVPLTSEWVRHTITQTFASPVGGNVRIHAVIARGTSNPTVYIRRPQLELGSTATAYQRVLSAFDVTEAGVQSCHYVQYDGSDDGMITNSIDFTATDKMSVFAGVRKTSDATAYGTVAELGTWGTNNGSFVISAPAGAGQPRYEFALRGTANAGYQPQTYAAPISNVLTSLMNIGAATKSEELVPRIDGVVNQTNDNLVSAGTGNFGNYALSFGRNKAATLAFNGRDYGIVVVGKATTADEIAATEKYMAGKTGVTL